MNQKLYEKRWVCIYRVLYMKNSVLDRLKSYFDEYFPDATKPTARNMFLSIDDTMVGKAGEKFELRSKLFDHAAHNGPNYLNSIVR